MSNVSALSRMRDLASSHGVRCAAARASSLWLTRIAPSAASLSALGVRCIESAEFSSPAVSAARPASLAGGARLPPCFGQAGLPQALERLESRVPFQLCRPSAPMTSQAKHHAGDLPWPQDQEGRFLCAVAGIEAQFQCRERANHSFKRTCLRHAA